MKRSSTDHDAAYQELESLLSSAVAHKEKYTFVSAKLEKGHLRQALETYGVALCHVDKELHDSVARVTGENMSFTFCENFSQKVKDDLRTGVFESFSREWSTTPMLDSRLLNKGNGMANLFPIHSSAQDAFTLTLCKTVHVKNKVAALNNMQAWEVLCEKVPLLHPSEWAPFDAYQVSEDGLKIMHHVQYKPTGLHYDGQMADAQGRIQVVYANDSGPVRLCLVPASNQARVRELIQSITNIDMKDGFQRHAREFFKQPRLKELLCAHSVTLDQPGLLMFCAGVWHFEGPNATKESSVFRLYMGVVDCTSIPREQLITLAYLRLHGWCMDPFAKKINKKHALFVNEKSLPNHTARELGFNSESPMALEFQNVIKGKSLDDMKQFLRENGSETQLALLGLKKEYLY